MPTVFGATHLIMKLTNESTGYFNQKIKEKKDTLDALAIQNPSKLRKDVEGLERNTRMAINEDLSMIEEVDKCILLLNNLKTRMNEDIDLLKDTQAFLNNVKIGTLEGLTRDIIKKHKIVPEDEFAQTLLKQPYNEIAARHRE